jgi:hypothetical protein
VPGAVPAQVQPIWIAEPCRVPVRPAQRDEHRIVPADAHAADLDRLGGAVMTRMM